MEPLDPSDPARVGSYTLTARLGSGGMGQVYLARTPSGRQVAIKVIRPALVQDGDFRARFAREVDAARRVGGFHTALVVDADPKGDPAWVATSYISGPTLHQAVRDNGPITPPALHTLAVGLAEGLKAVHDCGLVHRDLKPGNVILSDDGPRIIDFGIARPLDAESLTTREAVFGTLPYMSPEQTESSHVGPASDVFSLGTVLAYAATGASPFNGETMAATIRRLIGPPPDPGDVDPDTRALIAICWNHEPGQRPTAEAILTRFGALGSHPAGPPPGATHPTDAEPEPITHPPAQTFVESTKVSTDAPTQRAATGEPTDDTGGSRRRTTWLIAAALVAITTVIAVGIVALQAERGGNEPDGGAEPDTTGATEPATTLTGDEDTVEDLTFSPDGGMLATTGTLDETVRLWDTDTGQEDTTLDHPDDLSWVTSMAFSPDGTTLATGESDDSVALWEVG